MSLLRANQLVSMENLALSQIKLDLRSDSVGPALIASTSRAIASLP